MFKNFTNAVKNFGNAASGAVNNLTQGVQQLGQGAQQVGSGDLRGLQTMGGAVVNTGSNLYGNMADINRAGIDAAFSPLAGTPLYGLTAGNLKGGIGSLEGVVRGNIAGIQDLPTDVGAGVQQGLDQIGGAAQDLLGGLGNALGGGAGGAGGGVSAPQYYKDLAQKQAEYGMNLPDEFQQYEGDRFVTPSDRTTQGENLLADRVNQSNPFTTAINSAQNVANYQSGFAPSALNLAGPQANAYQNANAGRVNVNAGLQAQQFGNANQGLQGPVNYQQEKTLRDSMQQFEDPYTDRVVNQTIRDMDRARQMTANQISGDSAKAGAYGGSRSMLMQAENNRNFADRTAAAVGQLRSQGFQRAADLAQQENLRRLGLSASDLQNVRRLTSQGNLQGQNLTARDLQDVRGLQSQGALAAQGLQSRGALTAQGLGAQSDRDVMNYANQLQMQGNTLGADQARLAEQFRQGAGALNLRGAGTLGNLGQMQTADERQRIADLLAAGQAGDMRGQQQADFDYQQFVDETQRFPGQYLNNLQQSGGLAQSLISGPQPQKNPYSGLLSGAGLGLGTYGMLAGIPAAAPYALPAALGMGALGLLGG